MVCRTVGPTLAASLEPLGSRRNVANVSLYYGHYFSSASLFYLEVHSFFWYIAWFFLLSFQIAFPLPMIETALNLELIGTFYLCVLSKQLFLVPFHLICLFVFSFSWNSMPFSSSSALHGVNNIFLKKIGPIVYVTVDDILKKIKNLSALRATQSNDILLKMAKICTCFFPTIFVTFSNV